MSAPGDEDTTTAHAPVRPGRLDPMGPVPANGRDRRRLLLVLAVPATLTLIAEPLLSVVDTAIAGRIGATELGALGLATSLLGALTLVFNFLVFGTTSTVARALGRGDRVVAGRRVAHAAVVALLLGLVAAGIVLVGARAIVVAAGAVPELVDPTVSYMRVRALGIPFMLLGFVGHGAFRGAGDTRRPLLVVLVANVANLGLNLFFVFGLGWSVAGLAAATVIAEVIAATWLAIMATRVLGLDLWGHGLPTRGQVRELATVSRDLFLRTAGLVGGFAAITAAAARVGAETAAAHQVIWQVFMLQSFLLDGLAVASQTLTGRASGAGEVGLVRAVVGDSLRWAATVGAVLSVVLFLGQPLLVAAFTPDPEIKALVATAFWLPAIAMVLHSLVYVLDGLLMGAEDYGFIRTWTVIGGLVGAITAQVSVTLGGGLLSLWIAYELVMLLRGIPLLLRARSDRWLPTALGTA